MKPADLMWWRVGSKICVKYICFSINWENKSFYFKFKYVDAIWERLTEILSWEKIVILWRELWNVGVGSVYFLPAMRNKMWVKFICLNLPRKQIQLGYFFLGSHRFHATLSNNCITVVQLSIDMMHMQGSCYALCLIEIEKTTLSWYNYTNYCGSYIYIFIIPHVKILDSGWSRAMD